MNDRNELFDQVLDMIQKADARELELLWRILRGMVRVTA